MLRRASSLARTAAWLAGLWLLAWAGLAQAMAAPAVLELQAAQPQLDAWSAAQVRLQPATAAALDPLQVALQGEGFAAPTGPRASFGRQAGQLLWLRIPLRLADDGARDWWLQLDYPPLDEALLWAFCGGRLVQQATLGDQRPMAERHGPPRSHQVALALPPGQDCMLVLRARNAGPMTVPLAFKRSDALFQAESAEQALQGLCMGIGLATLVFALIHGLASGQAVPLWYAVAGLFSLLYLAAYHGLAAQYLWPANPWLIANGTPMLGVLIIASGARFVDHALQIHRRWPWASHLLWATSLAGLGLVLAQLAGWLGYGAVARHGALLGLLPLLVAVPAALLRLRDGDGGAAWMLLGWLVYGWGTATTTLMHLGRLPASWWNDHSLQIGSMGQLLAWAVMLQLQMRRHSEQAKATRREAQRLDDAAHTDALTGLGNRRGLQRQLGERVARSTPDRPLAAYLLDLDGFKAVNDQHGHDAGDELLLQFALRLRAAVRSSDLVARLGGDEFVVVAGDLAGPAQARQLGEQLLQVCRPAFVLRRGALPVSVNVGVTVGLALAPLDTRDPAELLRLADRALYAGKLGGKNRVGPPAGAAEVQQAAAMDLH
ncbi:MAG: GGDEF domain-containing protein [Burkholderiaceae bacterium]|nr:GGDEF domain-containing protein [Burkholderiaceae bacterium]